jgi:hypothetical protein
MSKPFKPIVSAFILLLLAAFFLVDTIPPRSLTVTRMFFTKRRILEFVHENNKLPSTLAELPAMPGYENETSDAWKRPLDYSTDDSGTVTLRSLGEDKRFGGDGDNRDIPGVFISRDAQGNLQEELTEWKQNPIRP